MSQDSTRKGTHCHIYFTLLHDPKIFSNIPMLFAPGIYSHIFAYCPRANIIIILPEYGNICPR